MTGTVVSFIKKKGYGFIDPDDGGPDVFVHHSAVSGILAAGQLVVFDIVPDRQKRRPKAANVSVIRDAP